MKDSPTNRYAFSPNSEVRLLSDGSGLAIYDGYSCDTHFIHSKKEQSEWPTASFAPEQIDLTFLIEEFGMSKLAAQHTIDLLIKQKVLWEIS
ncbi:MAG: hypothetical protein Alis3KO_10040 [Aliiglaciecola sp.]